MPNSIGHLFSAIGELPGNIGGQVKTGARGIGRQVIGNREVGHLSRKGKRSSKLQLLAAIGVDDRGMQNAVPGVVEDLVESAARTRIDEELLGFFGSVMIPPRADVAGQGIVDFRGTSRKNNLLLDAEPG